MLAAWYGGAADLITLEQERFGWGHDQVGHWLCEEWELPDSLADAIAGHHGRGEEPAPPAVVLVSSIRDIELDDVGEVVASQAATEFGFDEARVLALVDEAETEAADLARVFA